MATPSPTTEQPERTAPAHAPRLAQLLTLLVLAVTAVMVVKLLRHDVKDAEIWYRVGRRVLLGQPILRIPDFRYPPAFGVFVAPLCLFGLSGFFLAWYALNMGLFLLSVRWALRLVWPPAGGPAPARLHWVPALLVAVYALDNFFVGQTNIWVTFFLYWSMVELIRGREWRAGLPFAVTVATKAFTLPWIAYLIYRRHWRAAASVVLACVFFFLLLPAPFRGFSRNLAETVDWGRRVVEPYLTKGQAGDWGQHALDYEDQSLQAVLHRLLTPVNASLLVKKEAPFHVNFANFSEAAVNGTLLGLLALLAGGMVVACGLRPGHDPRLRGAELGLSVIVLMLASGLAWNYFFVMLLLPITAALAFLYRPEGVRAGTLRLLRAALYVHGIAVVLQWRALDGPYIRALGSICWAAVLLFLALALACWDLRHAPERAAETAP